MALFYTATAVHGNLVDGNIVDSLTHRTNGCTAALLARRDQLPATRAIKLPANADVLTDTKHNYSKCWRGQQSHNAQVQVVECA